MRRLGELPGLTRKITERNSRPGQHGDKNKKTSEYLLRLEEKQKLKFNYGVTETQLLNYVKNARKAKGSTGIILLQLLEMRLDNTIFRLGMAPTIPAARQLVTHGHITVNHKHTSIPSYQCKTGDLIFVKDILKSKTLVNKYLSFPGLNNIPPHLEIDKEMLKGRVLSVIEREWVALQLNELLIVEHFSRKS